MSSQDPTAAQVQALWNWVFPDGFDRSLHPDAQRDSLKPRLGWKQALGDAWMKAGEGVAGYTPELQQLRNQFGPSWLANQSAQSIDRLQLRICGRVPL